MKEEVTTYKQINDLVNKIKLANKSYRTTGETIMSDQKYDSLIEQLEALDPNNELLNEIGLKLEGERMQDLPVPMASIPLLGWKD